MLSRHTSIEINYGQEVRLSLSFSAHVDLIPHDQMRSNKSLVFQHPASQHIRQATLAQLQEHLRDLLPAPLLSSEDEGLNSRERIFSLRLTFECFLWQMLKPKTSCREVVRQVQTLFRLHSRGLVNEGDSAYVQARQRLPRERLEKAISATAQAADRRVGSGGQLNGRRVRVLDCSC